MARATVVVDSRMKAYGRELERGVGRALERTAETGVKRAKDNASSRRRTGTMVDSIDKGDVTRTVRGWAVAVFVGAWYGRFQETGAGARKGRAKTGKTKARRAAAGITHGGTKPARFLKRMVFGIRGELVDNLRDELKGAGKGSLRRF